MTSSPHSVIVVHTRVFAATACGGNPCPVVPLADGLTDDQMLRLARRYDLDFRDGDANFQVGQGYAMGSPSRIEAIARCADRRVIATAIRGSCRTEHVEKVPVS